MLPQADDPRLRAAGLSEQEFIGDLIIHSDNSADGLLEVYREDALWRRLSDQALLKAQHGYFLRYELQPQPEPVVFLVFKGDLVGVFHNDTLTIDPKHRGRHLSRELILAGYAQAPWKDMKQRKVTKAGAAALRSAYRFAKNAAGLPIHRR